MEPDNVASIAALAVALVALLVASAQAIQQYFVSGQLIRLCDSVVYNQMPGQGHRVWQFSQFRFRVVYSIPQVRLLPELWRSTATHVQSLPSNAARLPALSVHPKTSLSALAGEASWVSFVRTAQHSSGGSLRYTMVEGDADRCPSDLPVVPMQLSMRDVVIMATKAGMECTDVSFQTQSISMQGDAGTITSSRHPVLGALIHFASKQSFEGHGIQTYDGRIHPDWVARMLDTVTVAGRTFDRRDRKHFEEDEGTWIKESSDRTLVQYEEPARVGASASSGTLRQRRSFKPQSSPSAIEEEARGGKSSGSKVSLQQASTAGKEIHVVTRRPQDGEWLFSSSPDESNTSDTHANQALTKTAEATDLLTPPIAETFGERLRRAFAAMSFGRRHDILPTSEPKRGNRVYGRQSTGVTKASDIYQGNDSELLGSNNIVGQLNGQASRQRDEKKHTPEALSLAGAGKMSVEQIDESQTSPPHPKTTNQSSDRPPHPKAMKPSSDRQRLLLTNGGIYDARSGTIPTPVSSLAEILEAQRNEARSDFVADKWQKTFRQRRKERSRGRSQRDAQRHLVLKQISVKDARSDSPAHNHGSRKIRSAFKYPKLAIENPPPHQADKEHETCSDLDISEASKNGGRASSTRKQSDVKMVSKPQHGDLPDNAAGSRWSISSGSDDLIRTKRLSRRSHHRKIVGNGPNALRRDSTGSGEDLPRGRRRNSSLAAYSERHHVSSGPPSQPDPTVLPEQKTSMKPVQGAKRVRVLSPEEYKEELSPVKLRGRSGSFSPQMKPVLRGPTQHFPEDPDWVRPGVAAADQARAGKAVPEGARWTKIDRRLVSPEALQLGRERYEEMESHIIVLRVLTREEVQRYAIITQELRANRAAATSGAGEDAGSQDESSNAPTPSEASISHPMDERHPSPDQSSPTTRRDSPASPTYEGTAEADGRFIQQGSVPDRLPATSQTALRPDNADGSADCASAGFVSTESGDLSTRRREQDPDPIPAIRPNSASRQRSSKDHGFLTYDEELLFLHSDDMLKKLRSCTEQCKDVITTLDFCISFQAGFADNATEICEATKDCNSSLKKLLMTMEPLRDNKKAAEIIVADLSILLHGLRASLNILRSEFDILDITSLTPSSRKTRWKHTLDAFEERYLCSMLHSLDLVYRFAEEIHANFKIGVFKSPESALLKKHLAQASAYEDSASSSLPTSESFSKLPDPGSLSRPSFLRSPSRYVQTPLRSSGKAGSVRRRRRGAKHSDGSVDMQQGQPRTTGVSGVQGDLTYKPEFNHDFSTDDSSSTKTTLTSSESNATGEVSWFWLCQADVLPGCFATPWKSSFPEATCIGAISVFLQTIEGFTDKPILRYVASHDDCEDWLRLGQTTYPSYAHNANGGVVVAGAYEPLKIGAFETTIASLRLLESYNSQVDRGYHHSTRAVIVGIAELLSLDSWLSICGRTPDIINGPSRLLQSLPTLIQRVMVEFDLEFSSVDRDSRDGGLRNIKTISDSLLQFLTEQHLSKAEQLFTLAGLLRTAKMALCVARGSDTVKLRDVLLHDVQVYMA